MVSREYVAGIIDGEGCIGIVKVKGNLTVMICVSMTNFDVTSALKERYGGSLLHIQRKNPRWKPIWMWRVYAKKAEAVLHDIMPFLLVKKEQAEIAMQLRKSRIKSRGLNLDEKKNSVIDSFRFKLKEKINLLNKRGAA